MKATIENLERLIGAIDEKVAALPAHDASDSASWSAYWRAADAAIAELAAAEGGKLNTKWDGVMLKLAGIRVTCTSGSVGAMHNWQAAARRKIAQIKAGAA